MKNIISLIILFMLPLPLIAACVCPDDLDRRGYRCGRRSAFCKPGGLDPNCGSKTKADKVRLKLLAC